MKNATVHIGAGIPWMDQDRLADLDFANDIALVAEDETWLQDATERLSHESKITKTGPAGVPDTTGDSEEIHLLGEHRLSQW